MRLIEYKYCFIIEDFFSSGIVAGFTKPESGDTLPDDIYKALSFFNKPFVLSHMNQLHAKDIRLIDKPGMYDCDGLFTNEKNHLVIVKTADCLPLVLSDDSSKIIGVLHLGWRPGRAGILDDVPCDLSSSKVFAGVGLRKCCYEVGAEFLNSSLAGQVVKRNDKLYFDPVAFARDKLIAKGLRKDNFFDAGICSFCSDLGYFSHRRTKTKKRTLSFILNTKLSLHL